MISMVIKMEKRRTWKKESSLLDRKYQPFRQPLRIGRKARCLATDHSANNLESRRFPNHGLSISTPNGLVPKADNRQVDKHHNTQDNSKREDNNRQGRVLRLLGEKERTQRNEILNGLKPFLQSEK